MTGWPVGAGRDAAEPAGVDRRIDVLEQVVQGVAEGVAAPRRPAGWTLLVQGVAQSYVDLDDPEFLEFEYMRRVAAVVDAGWAAGTRVRALHLGGGGLTLPRYVAATRPGSTQYVIERDPLLLDLVRRALPVPPESRLRLAVGDARTAVAATPDARFDLVVADVYEAARMPRSVATVEFVADAARVLRPGGLYVVNVTDLPGLAFSRVQAATLRAVFGEVCVVGEPGMLRGRRFGNVVMAAAGEPGGLPAGLDRRVGRDTPRGRVVRGADLDAFISGARPLTDDSVTASGL